MPFFPSRDLRLFVGGRPVHGTDERTRTLRTMARTITHKVYERTSIGDPAARHDYLRGRSGTLNVSGWYDDDHGLSPMLAAAVYPGGEDRPVTFSVEGAQGLSTICPSVQWTSETTTSPEGEAAMIEAEGQFSLFRTALFGYEGAVSGRSPINVGNIDLRTQPIAIRATTPRLELISGNRAFLIQVRSADAQRLLLVTDDVEFDGGPGIPGTFRITSIVIGAVWANITVERSPQADLSGITPGQRNGVTGIRVVDTFTGDRIGLIHLSNLQRRDAVALEVAIQGTEPGTLNWTDFGQPRRFNIDGEGSDWVGSAYFDPGDGVRSISRARAQLRFLLSGGAQGAANDYGVDLRFDFAPRVVHH